MEPQRPTAPQYTLDVFADPTCVKDVCKAILHTIFFHRYFTPIAPLTRDLLDLTLPAIDDVDLETQIDQRAAALVREIDTADSAGGSASRGRGQLAILFYEKRRRKAFFFGKNEEEICWERWILDVTVGTPRTETDRIKVRKAMEKSLQKTAMKIVNIVNRDKDHIPPITTTESNPFPYQILVNPKSDGWSQRMGIFQS
ncbi:DUF1649-domain-containing protein [Eremomyces bilateralis CBS 781.70]|uniref:Autophagy-related protein 101 n=1 Tax=Eremomyces bilateralis CBS 781.70 TaxID=1392243 RepID=A0A6G1G2J6_9PEZI|nr:DUF1649-domain-containing protein [Eremomyces bilateralis CBS 781.70]KAF1812029.1 DUF1649-domain-containing protein [Eremomyces bilateralis CBS 781.70]